MTVISLLSTLGERREARFTLSLRTMVIVISVIPDNRRIATCDDASADLCRHGLRVVTKGEWRSVVRLSGTLVRHVLRVSGKYVTSHFCVSLGRKWLSKPRKNAGWLGILI